MELAAGSYARVIEAAKRLLKRKPNDPDAMRYIKETTEKLREQIMVLDSPAESRLD